MLLVAVIFSNPIFPYVEKLIARANFEMDDRASQSLTSALPPSNRQAKRQQAIQDAIERGETTYTYEATNPFPAAGQYE